MCELGFFPIFKEKDLSKVDKILALIFFQARKDFEGFKTAFFHLLSLSFVVDGLFTTPVYSSRRSRFVSSAFPDKKNLAQKRSLFKTNKFESKFYIFSKFNPLNTDTSFIQTVCFVPGKKKPLTFFLNSTHLIRTPR